MKWNQVKTILIIVFLGADLIFAANLARIVGQYRREEAQAREMALTLVEQKGVSVPNEMIPLEKGRSVLHADRSTESEEQAAFKLLGDYTEERPGGGMALYQSEKGEALFRNGSFLELRLFDGDTVGEEKQAVRIAEELMKTGGFSSVGQEPQATEMPLLWEIDYSQQAEGMPVFNGRWTVTLSESENILSGRWISPEGMKKRESAKNEAELLLCLPDLLLEEDASPVTIENIDAGWLAATAQDGGLDLIPVWKIESAQGLWYMDLSTGKAAVPE